MEELTVIQDELYKNFVKLFPEDGLFFKKMCKDNAVNENDGMHIMFAFVVVPFLMKIIRESKEKSEVAFDYIEKMEKSENPEIAEVVEFTILETLLSEDRDMYCEYAKFFGNETKKASIAIKKWINN